MWLWIALHTTTIFAAFAAGLFTATALSNRRWAEKCARCQTLMDRCNATPHLLSALSKLPPILHSTRGPHA